MGVHKVPQDVEADDKLLWMFTAKQAIFMGIAAISGGLVWLFYTFSPYLALVPLPFMLFFGTLGIFGALRKSPQPLETYLMARVRFLFIPRKRVWDKDGIIEHVNITAPKVEKHEYTDGLTLNEVENRLNSLATLMDTRGWSARNSSAPGMPRPAIEQSDRLVMPQAPAQQAVDIHESDDPMYQYGPVAQNLDQLTAQKAQMMRQQAIESMHRPHAEEQQPAAEPAEQQVPSYNPYPTNMQQRVITPASEAQNQSTSTMTQSPPPDIIRLSQNNDMSVSSIAKQADEVILDLNSTTES